MADFKFIACEEQGDVLRIAINRPPYNVLDIATMEEMNTALDMAMDNKTAKVLVITGSGDKTFSSGVDVMDHTPDKVVKMIDVFHGLLKRLMLVPIPTVAVVNGPALGGGTELCLACDMIVATTGTRFGLPEVKRGIMANGGGNSRLSRVLPRNVALELITTGEAFSAEFAAGHGMVNRVVEAEDLLETALGLARMIMANAPVAVKESLRVARQSADRSDTDLRRLSRERNKVVLATDDAKEGPRAFAEKRAPVWQGR